MQVLEHASQFLFDNLIVLLEIEKYTMGASEDGNVSGIDSPWVSESSTCQTIRQIQTGIIGG